VTLGLEDSMSTIRPHYSEARTILADVVPLHTPFAIQCEASQVCNIKCNYCMQSFIVKKQKQLMGLSTFKTLCLRAKEFDTKFKQFNFAGWGEPLVNRELPDMISHLRESNVTENIAIITNGLLLAPGLSLRLVDAGTDHVRISLQGMTSEKYWEICAKGIDFTALVDQIRFLYEHKHECRVSVKIADIALATGEEELFYETFESITDGMYVESIRPMFAQNKQDGKIISKYGEEHSPVIACPQPFFMMSVTATGDIFPCCSYYDPTKFGNILGTSLRKVWESCQIKKFQIMLLSGNRKEQEYYSVCRDCHMPDAVLTPGDELDARTEEIRRRLE